MDLELVKTKVRDICSEFGVSRLAVFGSVARGEDRPDSDIDLLARFNRPIGLPELIRLEDRFEKELGRRVDLGTEGDLHPLIESRVRKEMKVLYEV